MAVNQSSIFVVALLYSKAKIPNEYERKLFHQVCEIISNDPVIKDAIH